MIEALPALHVAPQICVGEALSDERHLTNSQASLSNRNSTHKSSYPESPGLQAIVGQCFLALHVALLISPHSEDKIDSIDQRLANIETLLRQSKDQSPSAHFRARNRPVDSPAVGSHSSISEDSSSYDTPAEVQFTAATSVLEQIISQDGPAVQHDSELASALKSLHSIVNRNRIAVGTSARETIEDAGPQYDEPAWDDVRAVLQRAKGKSSMLAMHRLVLANVELRQIANL